MIINLFTLFQMPDCSLPYIYSRNIFPNLRISHLLIFIGHFSLRLSLCLSFYRACEGLSHPISLEALNWSMHLLIFPSLDLELEWREVGEGRRGPRRQSHVSQFSHCIGPWRRERSLGTDR